MARIDCDAIVLRTLDYGESDRIVRLLARERGRLTVIAKHARKSNRRFPGSLDCFNTLRVEIRIRPRNPLGFLERGVLISPFLGLRKSLSRFALASYLVEILDRMAPENGAPEDTERLFAFAEGALHAIAGLDPDPRLRVLFELRILDALGLRPQFVACVRCGQRVQTARVDFLVAEGGVVCSTHVPKGDALVMSLHLGTLRALEQSFSYPLNQLGRLALGPGALSEAQQLLLGFCRFHLGLELKTESVLARALESNRLTAGSPWGDTRPLHRASQRPRADRL